MYIYIYIYIYIYKKHFATKMASTNTSCFLKKAGKGQVYFTDFGKVRNKFEHQENKLQSSRNNCSDPELTPSHFNITG